MKQKAFFTIIILWLLINFFFHSCKKEVHPQIELIEQMIGTWKTIAMKKNGKEVPLEGRHIYKFVDQKVIVLERYDSNDNRTFNFQSKWAMSDDGSYFNHFIYGTHEIVSVKLDTLVLLTQEDSTGTLKEYTYIRY